MIQRIQTLYLLITIVLVAFVIGFPLMELISVEDVFYQAGVVGVYNGQSLEYSLWPLLVLAIFNILLSLGSIFLYKNRMLQIRACVLNILLTIGFYLMLGGYYWILQEKFSAAILCKWTMVLPAVNIVLLYLAIRSIGKDEALVRAADRLR